MWNVTELRHGQRQPLHRRVETELVCNDSQRWHASNNVAKMASLKARQRNTMRTVHNMHNKSHVIQELDVQELFQCER